MIFSTKFGVRKADFYFDEAPVPVSADIIRYHQWRTEPAGFLCEPIYTRVVDLNQPESQIFTAMDRDTRKAIRRAEGRDGFEHSCHDGRETELLREICDLHDCFARLKHLPPVDRAHLRRLAEQNLLDFSLIRHRSGQIICWRTYYRTRYRARNLQHGSFYRAAADSVERNRIGRANRFSVWMDIRRFRREEVDLYDLGGWYAGGNDLEKLRINHFKKQFGGRVIRNFDCVRAETLAGRLALRVIAWRDRPGA